MLEISIKRHLKITHLFSSAIWHLPREIIGSSHEKPQKSWRLKKHRIIAKRKAFIWEINPGNFSWLKSALTLMHLLVLSFYLFIRGRAGASLWWMSFSLQRTRALGHLGSGLAAHRFWSVCSLVVVHRLICPLVYGIFPNEGLNRCPLHWQVDS